MHTMHLIYYAYNLSMFLPCKVYSSRIIYVIQYSETLSRRSPLWQLDRNLRSQNQFPDHIFTVKTLQ